ncbi:family 4 glycosyl hydrolase, partial [Streptococcus pyogenes]
VTANLGAAGARNVAIGPLPTAEKGWLQVMKAMELLTIEAAVTGNYALALQAFTINPLIPAGATARRVMDELFIAHKEH